MTKAIHIIFTFNLCEFKQFKRKGNHNKNGDCSPHCPTHQAYGRETQVMVFECEMSPKDRCVWTLGHQLGPVLGKAVQHLGAGALLGKVGHWGRS